MAGEEASISHLTKEVIGCFLRLISSIGTLPTEGQGALTHEEITDALERFQLWSGNIGASVDAAKRVSLDVRLKDAPEVRDQVRELLTDLSEALNDLNAIVVGQRPNRSVGPLKLEPYENSEGEVSRFEIRPVDESNEILKVILDCIKNLMRISMIIRKATPRDRFSKALQRHQYQFLDQFDIAHVAEKFPKLDTPERRWLKVRLGRAISQRRQFITYCHHHREKQSGYLADKFTPEAIMSTEKPQVAERDTEAASESGSHLASIQPTLTQASTSASTLNVEQLHLTVEDGDDDDDAKTYTTATVDPDEDCPLEWPRLYEVSKGRPEFECPFCCGLQTFRQERKWRRHAVRDLKPYVCCFGEGECDFELFTDRNAWFSHELQNHRHQWKCIFCAKEPFRVYERFEKHMRSKHKEVSGTGLKDIARVSQQPLQLIPALDCPFCDEWEQRLRSLQVAAGSANIDTTVGDVVLVDSKRFRRHVASHMEQLALFAVPRSFGGEDESKMDSVVVAESSRANSRDASDKDSEDASWPLDPPLHIAASKGNFEEVRRLLEEGADPNAKGETWSSAMRAANGGQKHDIWELLLQYGADNDLDLASKRSLLEFAQARGQIQSTPAEDRLNDPSEPRTLATSLDESEGRGRPHDSESRAPDRSGARAPSPKSPERSQRAMLLPLFKSLDKDATGEIGETELQRGLVNVDYGPFLQETTGMLMRMFDRRRVGKLDFDDFCGLWTFLTAWRNIFTRFDVSENGSINLDNFNDALVAFGYRLSARFTKILFDKFAISKNGEFNLSFDRFVLACVSLKRMTDIFKKYDEDRDGYITLAFEEYLTAVVSFRGFQSNDGNNSNLGMGSALEGENEESAMDRPLDVSVLTKMPDSTKYQAARSIELSAPNKMRSGGRVESPVSPKAVDTKPEESRDRSSE